MIAPKDMTKEGVLNWICSQEDDSDMLEIIKMCHKKIEATQYLKQDNK